MGKHDPAKVRPADRGHVAGLHREGPRDKHDANTIIAVFLLRAGGGTTISAAEFQAAERFAALIEVLPDRTADGDVVHFRIRA